MVEFFFWFMVVFIVGVFIYMLAINVSGVLEKDTDRFNYRNIIAMIILYGGLALLIFIVTSIMKSC